MIKRELKYFYNEKLEINKIYNKSKISVIIIKNYYINKSLTKLFIF